MCLVGWTAVDMFVCGQWTSRRPEVILPSTNHIVDRRGCLDVEDSTRRFHWEDIVPAAEENEGDGPPFMLSPGRGRRWK